MENIRNLQIHVDLLYGALPVSRNLKQGDTTRLTLTVFRGGKSYPLESLTPILNAKRADKLIYIQTSDYDVNDNSITYNLAPQIVAEPGRLQLEIELDDADGNIISSFTIGIIVEPRLFNGEEDVAPDDQNEIIDAAREAALSVAQARDAAQTAVDARDTAVQTINTLRDNAVADVNEAADKRVDEINAMGVNGTVRFDEAQRLTDAQMTQARANVGAASAAEVDKLSDENANLKGDLADKLPKSPVNWEPWTAVEQAAARERIGIPGDYELIEEISLEEDATRIERDTDLQGNSYNFKAIRILYEIAGGAGSGHIRTRLQDNIEIKGTFIPYGQAIGTSKRVSICGCELVNGFPVSFGVYGASAITGGAAQGTYSPSCYYPPGGNAVNAINSLHIDSMTSGVPIPSGSKIKIYGVRS